MHCVFFGALASRSGVQGKTPCGSAVLPNLCWINFAAKAALLCKLLSQIPSNCLTSGSTNQPTDLRTLPGRSD